MTLLASYTGKDTSAGEGETDITISSDGLVQFFLFGDISGKAVVKVKVKTSDAAYTEFPEMTFYKKTAYQFYVLAGDVLKVQFCDAGNASADVRHLGI